MYSFTQFKLPFPAAILWSKTMSIGLRGRAISNVQHRNALCQEHQVQVGEHCGQAIFSEAGAKSSFFLANRDNFMIWHITKRKYICKMVSVLEPLVLCTKFSQQESCSNRIEANLRTGEADLPQTEMCQGESQKQYLI